MKETTSQASSEAGITFELDGRTITALPEESILQVAKKEGIDIPHLCYTDGMEADGNCRACMVEIAGERVLAPSCCRNPTTGMVVQSKSKRALKSQRMVLELLQSDVAKTPYTRSSELEKWCQIMDVSKGRYAPRDQPESDGSHPGITVNMDACIQCTRCLRACRDIQVNDVIGLAYRGAETAIVFDLNDPMGDSSCVGCGECVQACPTGALMPAKSVGLIEPDKKVDTVCPYCGVGCLLRYHVKDNKILYTEGRNGPSNKNRLCVKGRYGFDYGAHRERLLYPMIRKPGVEKGLNAAYDPSAPEKMFDRVSWDEALAYTTSHLSAIKSEHGSTALAGFGSAKCSNEEAYLFQKLLRTGFGTNNVDHCTRLCHASSVTALLEGIGSGAVSNQVADVVDAEVIVIIGSDTATNHPVAATFIKNAKQDGKTLIVMDPRSNSLARHADHFLQFKPDTDVALINAMIHCVIEEGLGDEEFIANRTQNYRAIKENARDFPADKMALICGIDADTIRAVARCYAKAKSSIIFWGMGVSQHTHGTDNVRSLIALCLITGQIGRPGTGLHPLRGQNNVQGASDAGLIPMVFPDYQRVDNPDVHAFFEKAWNSPLDNKPGLTVVEICEAAMEGKIRGMYIMGENPAMSDPNLNHTRQAIAKLDHLLVQDIFLTETAAFADVILPASTFAEKTGSFSNTDRRVQLGRKALEMPGECRSDLWIIQDIARGMGLAWDYREVGEVYEEMRSVMPSIKGITWERLQREESVTYPCSDLDDPGQPTMFVDTFPTPTGKGNLYPTRFLPAFELPDSKYPLVLLTGRQLEHWHTGSMTRHSEVLDAIEPVAVVNINPDDMHKAGISYGNRIKVSSRRGELIAHARPDRNLSRGEIFIPFCYREAAANLLTTAALDPYGKIPELKYCAVRVEAVKDEMH